VPILRKVIDNSIEEKILTGLIISTTYCKQAVPLLKLEYFQAEHCKQVARWCLRYFRQYRAAPGRHIQDLFEQNRNKMTPEAAGLLEDFLGRLSSEYERSETYNIEYLLDLTVRYSKERALSILKEEIEALLAEGKTDEAERAALEYKQIERRSLPIVDVFDSDTARHLLSEDESLGEEIIVLPGSLGEMIGPFRRNSLVGVMGVIKRGKSFLVQEVATMAALKGYNVFYVSLEMGDRSISNRLYRRLSGRVKSSYKLPVVLFPVFDCQHNQTGECSSDKRENQVGLAGVPSDPSSYYQNPKYKSCTACRGDQPAGSFDPALWWYEEKARFLDNAAVQKFLRGAEVQYGGLKGRFRLLCQARLTLEQIEGYLDCLEDTEGFVADVIVVDYPAILSCDNKSDSRWERLDEIWQKMKVLAGVKHCLVLAPVQSNRRGASRRSLSPIDVAGDWGVMAHVDTALSLNQLPAEKRLGAARVGIVAERSGEFDIEKECLVLQQLDTGQMILDSEVLDFGASWRKRLRGMEDF